MSIFRDQKYADKALEKLFHLNKKWGSRDRGFIAEQTYEAVRWLRLLHFALTGEVQMTARLDAAYWWQIVAVNIIRQNHLELIELPEWEGLPSEKIIRARLQQADLPLAVVGSIPDWLQEIGEHAFGEHWQAELAALNSPAPVILRCNRLKTSPEALLQALHKEQIDCSVFSAETPDAIMLKQRSNVFSSEAFKNGWFEVQDAASQLVVQHLEVKPGLRVVDACAGAGGKTLHLASLMQKKGQIIALDTEQYKLDELKKRAKRAGADNIESRLIESTKTIKRLHDSADRLLLDVPCSGLGVLRRNPDAKWKLKPEFIQSIQVVQRDILQNYSKMLKKGGLMVYATCSILPAENELQVQYFLANNPEFTLLAERKTTPAKDNMDGFYMATLKRND